MKNFLHMIKKHYDSIQQKHHEELLIKDPSYKKQYNQDLFYHLASVSTRRYEDIPSIIQHYNNLDKTILTQQNLAHLFQELISCHITPLGNVLYDFGNREGRNVEGLYSSLENLLTYIEPKHINHIINITKEVNEQYKTAIDPYDRFEIKQNFLDIVSSFNKIDKKIKHGI